jgi:predicted transcriptional regulator/DNA-binding XRE family transcriptional regulator
MHTDRLYAGMALKRLRQTQGLTQTAMARALTISPSYLNLLEKNQRPLTARLMLQLAERFGFSPQQLLEENPGGGVDSLASKLATGAFADLDIDRDMIADWMVGAPQLVEAFSRAFEGGVAAIGGQDLASGHIALDLVRAEIERRQNHYADIDAQAEVLADSLRAANNDIFAALSARLREKHQIMIRVLPEDILPEYLHRFDMHARQLQLAEMLTQESRTFRAAYLVVQLEFRDEIELLAQSAKFGDDAAEKLYRRHLSSYFAAAIVMPYGRFLRACDQTGYNIVVLQRRFGASFEQVAHRLTTLQRVGQRGLPFFMIKVDRAGQFSKRYSGASGTALTQSTGSCPLWQIHYGFSASGNIRSQLVETEDGTRWLTLARIVGGQSVYGLGRADQAAEHVIGLGVRADFIEQLTPGYTRNIQPEKATPIGTGCRSCIRDDCRQRAEPQSLQRLHIDEQSAPRIPFASWNIQ